MEQSPPAIDHGETTDPARPGVDRSRPYLSCEWIESGLAFNRRGLHACLIVHHGRGFPKLCDFEGGEVPWDLVRAGRADIIRQNQAGGHPDCLGCPHLVEKQWPEPPFAIERVAIAHFMRCNIFCNYCFLQTQDPASFKDGFDPYEVGSAIDALIRDGLLAPDATFDWGGGEPTIYPEFDAILERVTERGATTWVHTNATRFPKPLANGMNGENVRIICSVDAGFPETYLRMKGRDLFEKVWRTLVEYIEAGCDVHVKYIVKEENASAAELRAFIARLEAIGARHLIVDTDYDYPDPSKAVREGIRLLHALGPAHGIHTTFGATGAQFAPEADGGRRVWEGADNEQYEPTTPHGSVRGFGRLRSLVRRMVFRPSTVRVTSGLTGAGVAAQFDGPATRVEGTDGTFRIRGLRGGELVRVVALGHEPGVFRASRHRRVTVSLRPTKIDPDALFGSLVGYTLKSMALENDFTDKLTSRAATDAGFRTVSQGNSHAWACVVALDPDTAAVAGVLERFIRVLEAANSSDAAPTLVDGRRAYTGEITDGQIWVAGHEATVLVLVVGSDRVFIDGVVGALLRPREVHGAQFMPPAPERTSSVAAQGS